MIEIEILSILSKYKKAEEYEKKKLEESLKKIILENKENFLEFAQKQQYNLDDETKKLLQELYEEIDSKEQEENNQKITEKEEDYTIIKNYYNDWKEEFQNNNSIPNQNCENIIKQIINKYVENDFETIEKILEIKEDETYNKFCNMLNNYLRKYFAQKIQNYYKSEDYIKLGFLKKKNKKKKIIELLNQIGQYKFNSKKIIEVLK